MSSCATKKSYSFLVLLTSILTTRLASASLSPPHFSLSAIRLSFTSR